MPNSADSKSVTAATTHALQFDWQLSFSREPTQLASDYWRSCLNGRAMPTRADLNPSAMRKFTPHIGLVDIRRDTVQPQYFVRRAGGQWEDVFGPITGRFVHDFLPPEIEVRWRKVFDAVCEKKAPLRMTTGIELQGKQWLTMEMLVAPLGESGEPNMLLVAFDAWGRH